MVPSTTPRHANTLLETLRIGPGLTYTPNVLSRSKSPRLYMPKRGKRFHSHGDFFATQPKGAYISISERSHNQRQKDLDFFNRTFFSLEKAGNLRFPVALGLFRPPLEREMSYFLQVFENKKRCFNDLIPATRGPEQTALQHTKHKEQSNIDGYSTLSRGNRTSSCRTFQNETSTKTVMVVAKATAPATIKRAPRSGPRTRQSGDEVS